MVILKLFWDTSFPKQLAAQSHPDTLIWLAFPPYPLQFARELQQRNAGRISTRYSPHLLQSMHKYQRRAATVWEIRIEKKTVWLFFSPPPKFHSRRQFYLVPFLLRRGGCWTVTPILRALRMADSLSPSIQTDHRLTLQLSCLWFLMLQEGFCFCYTFDTIWFLQWK